MVNVVVVGAGYAGVVAVNRLAAHARRSGLPVDRRGRLRITDTLARVDHPRIIGVGDAAGHHLRMSCQSATPVGAHAADTTLTLATPRGPRLLSVGFARQSVQKANR